MVLNIIVIIFVVMGKLDFIFNEKEYNEENMIKEISSITKEINYLTSKTKNYLKHFFLQSIGITLCIVFSITSTATIFFSVASFISFMLSSSYFNERKEKIDIYWSLILDYKKKKILTQENKNLIEKFNIEKFWFEK